MSCDVVEVTQSLKNEQSSLSELYVTSPTSQSILQPLPRFTYVTTHSPTLPLLHLRHSSFSNPSFASPTSQDFHLRHLASRPCLLVGDCSALCSMPMPQKFWSISRLEIRKTFKSNFWTITIFSSLLVLIEINIKLNLNISSYENDTNTHSEASFFKLPIILLMIKY